MGQRASLSAFEIAMIETALRKIEALFSDTPSTSGTAATRDETQAPSRPDTLVMACEPEMPAAMHRSSTE